MKIGDKFEWNYLIYTVWLVEDEIVHAIDENGNGICINQTEIENADTE